MACILRDTFLALTPGDSLFSLATRFITLHRVLVSTWSSTRLHDDLSYPFGVSAIPSLAARGQFESMCPFIAPKTQTPLLVREFIGGIAAKLRRRGPLTGEEERGG